MRRYLLGQLDEADAEQLELRLLSDPSFAEEFDTIVDEITDQYAGNEIVGEDRKRVEQYFLRTSERQDKLKFAGELLERARIERGSPNAVKQIEPGVFDRVRSLWGTQPFSMRLVTIVATVVIVAGLVFLVSSRRSTSGSYALIALNISSADRATGADIKTVKLAPDTSGVNIELTLPTPVPQAKNYRVELIDAQQSKRNLPVAERKAQSVIVAIPRNEITYGSYIIHLYAVNPDGTEQRIRGSYYFNVE